MTRSQVGFVIAALLVVIGLLILLVIPHWFWEPLGVCTGNSCGYQLWSGIAGSCATSSGIWTGACLLYYRHQCHAPGCLRIGKHATADGAHQLCPKHHPDLPDRRPTLDEIHARHHAAKSAR